MRSDADDSDSGMCMWEFLVAARPHLLSWVHMWISSEISLASASTVRAHFGRIFKATTECAT